MSKHILFKPQVDFDTWITPDTPLPMTSWSYAPNIAQIEKRLTGVGRGLYRQWNGSKSPEGSFEMPVFPDYMGTLFKAAGFSDVTSTQEAASTAYRHAMHLDDTADWLYLSMQAQNFNEVYNLLSVALGGFTISAQNDDTVMVSFDFMARDEAKAGGTWDYDGSTAESKIDVSTTPYPFGPTIRPLMFFDGKVQRGAVDSFSEDGTTHQMTMSSPTDLLGFESVEVAVNFNLELVHTFDGLKVPHAVWVASREITISMDLDQSAPSHDYYDEYRAGTQFALRIPIVGEEIEAGHNYSMFLSFPLVKVTAADPNEISGDNDRQTRSVECVAMVDPTLERDMVIEIIDTQTSY